MYDIVPIPSCYTESIGADHRDLHDAFYDVAEFNTEKQLTRKLFILVNIVPLGLHPRFRLSRLITQQVKLPVSITERSGYALKCSP